MKPVRPSLGAAALMLVATLPTLNAAESNHDFNRWEPEISAFERQDRTNPPPKGALLFAGSSTIRIWTTLATDFPGYQVVNRGFGGSEILDSTHFADRIIFPYAPSVIYFRAGGNDLANGKSPEQVFSNYQDFVATIHSRLPETEIVWLAWNPTIARWDQHEKEMRLNTLVRDFTRRTPLLKYIDAYDLTLGEDGKPRADLLRSDKLHLNAEGYRLLAERVRPYLPALPEAAQASAAVAPREGDSPADHLPPYIQRVTWFGERADWSHDGNRILFLSKTFGDAMELDLGTKRIRNLTAHYPHHGYTRALYLANGDILLSGPATFDPAHTREAREQCYLYVLDKRLTGPAVPLGTKCSEGPAVSRSRMHIAWTHVAAEYPEEMPAGSSRMQEADIVTEDGVPKLANQRTIIDSRDLLFRCTLETQNFRPPAEKELIFSAYGYQGTDVCGVDLATKKVTNYSDAPNQYDEPEGIYPDGWFTLVECDKSNHQGSGHVDLWKLKLDGSGDYQRITFFSDYPGYKASNPVVSDDGRYIAFQMAKARDAAGVGHGLFVLDLTRAGAVLQH